ncbi:MAG: serine hydrolase [Bacteroidota bacterium]
MSKPLLALAGLAVLVGCRSAMPTPPSADDLRQRIATIVAEYPEATVAVAVRDAHTGLSLDLNADRRFHAASTMKVPVMIEAFRQVEAGRLGWDDPIPVENRFTSIVDGSTFSIGDDSDDALYTRLGGTMPLRDLTRRAITTSSNLATNLMMEVLTADSVQATTLALGGEGMLVLRGVEDLLAFEQGLSNRATAGGLAALMEAIRDGRAVSESASREMLDILFQQEFDEMIPAGLPAGTRAAHKTGWITRIHHDAAIVYPEDALPYVLVVLTEGLDDHDESARLGAEVARVVHRALR